ncbi:hypothetical protein O3P69_001362 [Scylla paramamosain]|uniref:Uncharacterized protein n=1 Tax=Scylla paramamosain TaxID=85552 RepID=A0AAW0UPZ4_SCYPA
MDEVGVGSHELFLASLLHCVRSFEGESESASRVAESGHPMELPVPAPRQPLPPEDTPTTSTPTITTTTTTPGEDQAPQDAPAEDDSKRVTKGKGSTKLGRTGAEGQNTDQVHKSVKRGRDVSECRLKGRWGREGGCAGRGCNGTEKNDSVSSFGRRRVTGRDS